MFRGIGLALILVTAALATAAPSSAATPRTGSVTVRVLGLPAGQRGDALLEGPDGLKRRVSAPGVTLRRAPVGAYRLTLSPVRITRASGAIRRGATASALKATAQVRLTAGRHAALEDTYTSIVNPGLHVLADAAVAAVTGPAEDPTGLELRGATGLARGDLLSVPPTAALPRGVLARVHSVVDHGATTEVTVTAASVYEVAPNYEFDVPLKDTQAQAADYSAGCSAATTGVTPYRNINNATFSGGWSTVDVFGVHITDGVRASVHFTTEAGVEVSAGLGVSCSLSASFYASGMAGPIPVTAGIEGELSASAAVGGALKSGGSIEVDAGGHTIGVPPELIVDPDVSFTHPKFTLTAKEVAQATAGIGVTVKAGIGAGGAASITLNVGSSLSFTAEPGSCGWQAKFGQFSVEGELLDWHLSTPSTPALFTLPIGGNYCPTKPGGGSSSGGSSGSSGSGGSSGPGGSGGAGGGGSPPTGGGEPTPGEWTSSVAPLPSGVYGAYIAALSCAAPGNCTAIAGETSEASGELPDGYAYLLIESDGTWSAQLLPTYEGKPVPLLPGVQLKCPSVGNCVGYMGKDGATPALMLTETKDAWSVAPLPTGPERSGVALADIACPEANACVAVGETEELQPVILTQAKDDTWTASAAPVPAGAECSDNHPGICGGLTSISCPRAGACVAVGSYQDEGISYNSPEIALEDEETGSGWVAHNLPFVHPAETIDGSEYGPVSASVAAVSCAAAGECTATGYGDGERGEAGGGYVLSPHAAAWEELPSPASELLPELYCYPGGDCTTSGNYEEEALPHNGHEIVYYSHDGKWLTGPESTFSRAPRSLSCASAADCVAVGAEGDSFNFNVENAGAWTALQEPAGLAGQWESYEGGVGDRRIGIVECPAVGECVAAVDDVNVTSPFDRFPRIVFVTQHPAS